MRGKNEHPMVMVWVTEWGVHAIPDKFKRLRFTKSGMPDKRYKMYSAFMKWLEEVERREA